MITKEQFFNIIAENCKDFGKTSEFSENNDYPLVFANIEDKVDCNYNNGATKSVIIPIEEDYVVKIPYSGYFTDYYNENTETRDYGYVDFVGANNTCNDWDYCLREVEVYSLAKEFGVEQFFCKTELMGTVNNYPIYAQEKAVIWEYIRNYDDYLEEDKKEMRNILMQTAGGYSSAFLCWLCDCMKWYGKAMITSFLEFLDDNYIRDLHSANLGYVNKRPVIVDYAGFNEE